MERVQAAGHRQLWTTSQIPAKLRPMDKRTPPPSYPCGHCRQLIPRVQALRQGGYCRSCEFMTRAEVQQYLGITEPTVTRHLPVVRILSRVLVHRSDVEQMRARLLAKNTWLSRLAA